MPVAATPQKMSPADIKVVSKSFPRGGTPAKTSGSARYGVDVALPGMLNATIRIAPVIGGKVRAVQNEKAVLQQPGMRRVITLDNAVIAVAAHYWQAQRAAALLDITFVAGDNAALSTAMIDDMAEKGLDNGKAVPVVARGDALKILDATPGQVIEGRYSVPHLAHAAMEPMNATVHVQKDRVDVWGSIQSTDATVATVAKICGLPESQVFLHIDFLGGSFGGKIVPDFVAQATKAAKIMGCPVKLIRSRDMDIQHAHLRPNQKGRPRRSLTGQPMSLAALLAVS